LERGRSSPPFPPQIGPGPAVQRPRRRTDRPSGFAAASARPGKGRRPPSQHGRAQRPVEPDPGPTLLASRPEPTGTPRAMARNSTPAEIEGTNSARHRVADPRPCPTRGPQTGDGVAVGPPGGETPSGPRPPVPPASVLGQAGPTQSCLPDRARRPQRRSDGWYLVGAHPFSSKVPVGCPENRSPETNGSTTPAVAGPVGGHAAPPTET